MKQQTHSRLGKATFVEDKTRRSTLNFLPESRRDAFCFPFCLFEDLSSLLFPLWFLPLTSKDLSQRYPRPLASSRKKKEKKRKMFPSGVASRSKNKSCRFHFCTRSPRSFPPFFLILSDSSEIQFIPKEKRKTTLRKRCSLSSSSLFFLLAMLEEKVESRLVE